mgnify:CR=1 FL=1
MVPKLNELHEKYSEQGLVIVGVTNESANLVDKSIESTGSRYPIAMVSGGAADAAMAVKADQEAAALPVEAAVTICAPFSTARAAATALARSFSDALGFRVSSLR